MMKIDEFVKTPEVEKIIIQARDMAVLFLQGFSKAAENRSAPQRNLLMSLLLVNLMSCTIPVMAETEKTTVENVLEELVKCFKINLEKMREEKEKRLKEAES